MKEIPINLEHLANTRKNINTGDILCFKRDPFIKECFYSAKNNEKNSIYNEIFEGFIADIEEVHSL